MEKNLNEVDNTALRNIEEEVEMANNNLNNVLGNLTDNPGGIDIHSVWSYKGDFETYMRCGNDAISDFEKYVIEHPLTLFDKEVIEEFEYQKELYKFNMELVKDVLKEAFKKSIQIRK